MMKYAVKLFIAAMIFPVVFIGGLWLATLWNNHNG